MQRKSRSVNGKPFFFLFLLKWTWFSCMLILGVFSVRPWMKMSRFRPFVRIQSLWEVVRLKCEISYTSEWTFWIYLHKLIVFCYLFKSRSIKSRKCIVCYLVGFSWRNNRLFGSDINYGIWLEFTSNYNHHLIK